MNCESFDDVIEISGRLTRHRAKYPLAMIDALLDALGDRLGAGYDIGCHTAATISKSDLNQKASEKLLTMLVGAFHGHGHNRLCQLKYLATYVKGLGLEDLEGCECFFSKSNALAKAVRYASRFHRQQEITTYMKNFDTFETYTNLSKFEEISEPRQTDIGLRQIPLQ